MQNFIKIPSEASHAKQKKTLILTVLIRNQHCANRQAKSIAIDVSWRFLEVADSRIWCQHKRVSAIQNRLRTLSPSKKAEKLLEVDNERYQCPRASHGKRRRCLLFPPRSGVSHLAFPVLVR